MLVLVFALAAASVCIGLVCFKSHFPKPIRGACVGFLVGAAVGFPLAFALLFLAVMGAQLAFLDSPVVIAGTHLTPMIWLPALIAIVGLIIGTVITCHKMLR
jgi:hypothetical protein